ncbi:hypothetical protein Tco_1404284 [Tanacetum coccineum]
MAEKSDGLDIVSICKLYDGVWEKKYWSSASVPRIGDRRIRRLSAYKQWKAASKTVSKINKGLSAQKRRLYQFDSASNSNDQRDSIEDGTSLSAVHDSHATVSFLKRTVTEFVTAIFSGELHVGVMLQRKRIRADNKTLLQTGICHDNVLDALGFTLESHDLQVEDLPMVPLTATPKPLLRRIYSEAGSKFHVLLNQLVEQVTLPKRKLVKRAETCHSDWNIEDRLFSVTLNKNQPLSEIGINGLRSLLSSKTPCILNGQLLLTNCLASSLTSIAQEALQMCEEAVEKVRNCVKYVKTSEPSEDYFLGLKQLQIHDQVMDGSPENSSRAFEIAKFAAGSTTVAAFRVSSLSITSLLVSMSFLLVCNSNKVNKAEDELLGCICEENRLLSVVVVAYTD